MTAAKRASIVLPLAGLSIVLALAIATQQVAGAFHYPAAFGRGLFDVGRMRIYAPWSFALWYVRYARSYQQAFDLAALIALAVALLPAMMAIGLTRGAHRQPRRFGQGAWADLADVQKAKLVEPSRETSGRVLGRFEGRYLTYAGIEHAIIVGASRSGKGAGHVVPTLIAWPPIVIPEVAMHELPRQVGDQTAFGLDQTSRELDRGQRKLALLSRWLPPLDALRRSHGPPERFVRLNVVGELRPPSGRAHIHADEDGVHAAQKRKPGFEPFP